MPLIEPAQCDSVRRAIDTTYKKRQLPDTVILDPIYAGQAELLVRKFTNDSTPAAVTAAIYFCAALLVENDAVPQVTRQSQGDQTVQVTKQAAAVKGARLRERAMEQIALTTPIPPEPVATDQLKSDVYDISTHVPVKSEW